MTRLRRWLRRAYWHYLRRESAWHLHAADYLQRRMAAMTRRDLRQAELPLERIHQRGGRTE